MTVVPLEPTTTINTAPVAPPAPVVPNPGWPGQPPGPPNFPSAQPGSGQPGYAQPGYSAPGYAAPPGYTPAQPWVAAAPTYSTSSFVVLAAMVLVILGVAVAVLGAWLLTQGPQLNDLIQRMRSIDLLVFKPTKDQLKAAFSASPGALIVLGVLQLLVGAFVLAHRGWARWLGLLLGLLGLLLSIVAVTSAVALVPGQSVQLIVAIVLLVGYALVVLALLAGGGHFRRRYPGR
jgi:hypothetical protein